jgi:hydrogenase maturation factor
VVDRFYVDQILTHMTENGENAAVIGEVLAGSTDVQLA